MNFDGLRNLLSRNQSLKPSRHRILNSRRQPLKGRTYPPNERASYSLNCLGNSSWEQEGTVRTSRKCFIIWDMYKIYYKYEVHTISFQTFFVWALLLIVYTWNSSPLWSNLLRLKYTCCTVPTTSGRPYGSPLVWACQWPSSQPLSSPHLSHNDSLWA